MDASPQVVPLAVPPPWWRRLLASKRARKVAAFALGASLPWLCAHLSAVVPRQVCEVIAGVLGVLVGG